MSASAPAIAVAVPGISEGAVVRAAYAAHTDAGTFFLDEEGICTGFTPSPDQSGSFRVRADAAHRCVGAQYVAAIDVTEPGALVALPRVGAALLLGIVDENGRISLVRTGPIVRYETLDRGRDSLALVSDVKVDVEWDDESTAAGPAPVRSAPPDAPVVTAIRPAAPDAEPTPVVDVASLIPAAKSSNALSEDPTHPTQSIRRAVPLKRGRSGA